MNAVRIVSLITSIDGFIIVLSVTIVSRTVDETGVHVSVSAILSRGSSYSPF